MREVGEQGGSGFQLSLVGRAREPPKCVYVLLHTNNIDV